MTENEEMEMHEQVEDNISLNMETKEKRASMSVRNLILSQGNFAIDSVQYRLYEAELKDRHINKQLEMDELILTKQHALNLEILRKQNSFNRTISKRNNKVILLASVISGVIGIVGVISGVFIKKASPCEQAQTLTQRKQGNTQNIESTVLSLIPKNNESHLKAK